MNSGVRSGLMRVGGTARTSDLNVSGITPTEEVVAGIFEKIDEKIEYAYGRRDLFAEDRRYWDGYIDGLEAVKRIIKELEDEYWKAEEAWSFFIDRKDEGVSE